MSIWNSIGKYFIRKSSISQEELLLSTQMALLTNVRPSLRGVCVQSKPHVIEAYFYIDGPISEDDLGSMEEIMTEIIADTPSKDNDGQEFKYVYDAFRVDAPQSIDCAGNWVYFRYE